VHGEGRDPAGNEGHAILEVGKVFCQALILKGFVLQVRGTANSGESGDLSTHVVGERCEPWGQGGDPRAEASVSVVISLGFPGLYTVGAAALFSLTVTCPLLCLPYLWLFGYCV
jgi:hypothetical protein